VAGDGEERDFHSHHSSVAGQGIRELRQDMERGLSGYKFIRPSG
jgi:hypothetical protein